MRMYTVILAALAMLSSQSIAEQGNMGKKAQASDTGGSGWLALADEFVKAPAEDSDLSSTSEAAADRWRFQLVPYAWLPAMRGSVTVLGMKQPVSLSLCDLFPLVDELDVIVPLQVQARHGRWKFWLDVQYIKMSDRQRQRITRQMVVGPLALNVIVDMTADVTMQMLLSEFGVDYELLKLPLGQRQTSALRFDVRAGGRYVYMKSELEISAQIFGQLVGPRNVVPFVGGLTMDSGGSREWIEPLVGAAVWWDVNDRLRLMARGDIGGFGLGSDLTWQVVGGAEWDLCDWAALFAGYRLLDIDFEEGSGQSKFAFDVQMHGPYLAVIFRF